MQKERPLSPHLQIYKPQLTSMLSVMHRGTGIFLALGTPILVFWLMSIASGVVEYQRLQACLSHWFGLLVLFGWSFALFYHLCNGIRHLFWDVGRGYEIKDLYTSGKIVLLVSVIMTILTWVIAIQRSGGAS